MTSMRVLLPFLLFATPLASRPELSPPQAPSHPLPTFPIPEHSLTGPGWPAPSWPARMRSAASKAFDCTSCQRLSAFHVDLGALGPGAILTQDEDVCGQGGNCSTFVLLYHAQAHLKAFTFGGPGSSRYFVIQGKGQVPDLIATYDYPCCSANAQHFSFSGETFVESGCDDVEFTESLWDMEHAHIKPCDETGH